MTTDTQTIEGSDDELVGIIGQVTTVEDGTYPATLTNVENFEYQDGFLRRWTFALDAVDSDGNPATVDAVSSTALGPKSKAFGWIAALLGRTPEKGEEIRRSMLVGRSCLVTVVLNADGYSKIEAVVAALKRPRKPDLTPRPNDEGPLFPDEPPRVTG
jgi:hypothetical protein